MKILTKSKEKEITEALITLSLSRNLMELSVEQLDAMTGAIVDIGWAVGGHALCEAVRKEAKARRGGTCMDLIDADALTAEILSDENQRADRMQFERYAEMVKRQPTVDAVPVVRCKDCRYYDKTDGSCNQFSGLDSQDCWFSAYVDEDEFCSRGERREE